MLIYNGFFVLFIFLWNCQLVVLASYAQNVYSFWQSWCFQGLPCFGMNNKHCFSRHICDGNFFVILNLTDGNRTIFYGYLVHSILNIFNASILYVYNLIHLICLLMIGISVLVCC